MIEQLRRIRPPVALELPHLPRREHRDHTLPVIRLEVLRALDNDEPQGRSSGDGWHHSLRVQDVDRAACAAFGLELPLFEKLLDIGHAEERGRGGRQHDDGLEAALARCGWFLHVGNQRWVAGD